MQLIAVVAIAGITNLLIYPPSLNSLYKRHRKNNLQIWAMKHAIISDNIIQNEGLPSRNNNIARGSPASITLSTTSV